MISVIVPVYNTEKYLKKCLDSIVKQTYKDFEIIIVNDGSPDNSEKIIKEYEKKYPKIVRAFKKTNGGLSSARNYGIKKAKGKYLAFIDSDDWIEKDYLKLLVTKAEKDNLDIVLCDTIMEYSTHNYTLKTNLMYSSNNIKNYLISYPMACIRLFKKDLFDEEYSFTENILYEDLCLCPTFVNKTDHIGFVDKGLYHYLQRDNSIMNQKEFNDKLYDIIKVLNIVYDSFKSHNNLEKYHDELEYLYITHLLRSTTLRFLDYKNGEEKLICINEEVKNKFPNWKNNKYLKSSSFKLKLVVKLAYNRNYKLIKILKRLGGS